MIRMNIPMFNSCKVTRYPSCINNLLTEEDGSVTFSEIKLHIKKRILNVKFEGLLISDCPKSRLLRKEYQDIVQ